MPDPGMWIPCELAIPQSPLAIRQTQKRRAATFDSWWRTTPNSDGTRGRVVAFHGGGARLRRDDHHHWALEWRGSGHEVRCGAASLSDIAVPAWEGWWSLFCVHLPVHGRYAEGHKVLAIVLVSACVTDLGDANERQSGYYSRPWLFDRMVENTEWTMQYASTGEQQQRLIVPWSFSLHFALYSLAARGLLHAWPVRRRHTPVALKQDDPFIPISEMHTVRDGLSAVGPGAVQLRNRQLAARREEGKSGRLHAVQARNTLC